MPVGAEQTEADAHLRSVCEPAAGFDLRPGTPVVTDNLGHTQLSGNQPVKPMNDENYLISQAQIESMKGLRKTHFLNSNAVRTNKSLGDLTGLTGFGFHLIEIEPGHESTEHHCHHHEDECVYVLSGSATAFIGDEAFEVGAGDFIGYRKGGLAHSIRNTGNQVLRCIVVGERNPHDVGDYPRQKKRIYRQAGLPWNLVDHEAIELVGAAAGSK